MVQITNFDGLDLTANPPEQMTVSVPDDTSVANIHLECLIIERDVNFLFKRLSGTVTWGDGKRPDIFSGAGTISLDLMRALPVGDYVVRVEGANYSVPLPERISANIPYHIAVTSGQVPANIVYGPIMPKDAGFPNKEQWSFDTGKDLEILTSSVKMLLLTSKGERVMLPEYGTNIRLILFEFQSAGVESMVQQEIVDALTKWEPRVALQYLSVEKTADREYTIQATFLSKLNQQPFSTTLTFK